MRKENFGLDLRSKNLFKNIGLSFVLKGCGVCISFLQLPLTVHYLSPIEYGIWVTLLTMMTWINRLDMGIGLGVRNNLAIAVSLGNIERAKAYISTGIFAMFGIASILMVIFWTGIQFIDEQIVFNTKAISNDVLHSVVAWTGTFFIITFFMSIISQFYYAYQEAAKTGMLELSNSIIMLVLVYYLTLQETHNILYFVFAFGIASISSKLLFSVYFFIKHREVIPDFSLVSTKVMKNITGIGIKFFIIQLCTIFCFSIANVLVTQLLGPEYVRSYDIVFKLMNFSVMIQSLILTPLWSAYTDAYARNDIEWIKTTLRKTNLLLLIFIPALCLIAWKIEFLVEVWLNIEFSCEPSFLILMVMYHVVILVCGNYCNVLNGIGKVNVQLVAYMLCACVVVPLSYISVVDFGLGLDGIILSFNISTMFLAAAIISHCYYLLSNLNNMKN